MKLSLMKNFYDTVDSERRSPILDTITSRWFESADTSIIRASANFVARVNNGDATYYLRLNHETERTLHHIDNEVAYIQRLIAKGINANEPVTSLTGKLVESVETELGILNAVLFSEMKGEHIEVTELDLAGFSKWGASLAEIHNAGHGLELENAPTWEDQLNLLSERSPEDTILMNEANTIRDKLSDTQIAQSNYGLTVFDFEMDNIKWDDGKPGFMDFDDYCVHWYAADIAYALRDLYDDKMTGFNPSDERFQEFLRGYRTVREVTDEELDMIPVFIRLHNLYFYARIRRANTGHSNKDPDWVKNFSKRLGEKNEGYLRDINENPVT
jgi:Ser/Thr protein kinase RdoA (MazF antagonist)